MGSWISSWKLCFWVFRPNENEQLSSRHLMSNLTFNLKKIYWMKNKSFFKLFFILSDELSCLCRFMFEKVEHIDVNGFIHIYGWATKINQRRRKRCFWNQVYKRQKRQKKKRKGNVQVSSPNLSQMLLERNFLRSRKNKWTNNWKEK